jgi:hypothetical protein
MTLRWGNRPLFVNGSRGERSTRRSNPSRSRSRCTDRRSNCRRRRSCSRRTSRGSGRKRWWCSRSSRCRRRMSILSIWRPIVLTRPSIVRSRLWRRLSRRRLSRSVSTPVAVVRRMSRVLPSPNSGPPPVMTVGPRPGPVAGVGATSPSGATSGTATVRAQPAAMTSSSAMAAIRKSRRRCSPFAAISFGMRSRTFSKPRQQAPSASPVRAQASPLRFRDRGRANKTETPVSRVGSRWLLCFRQCNCCELARGCREEDNENEQR